MLFLHLWIDLPALAQMELQQAFLSCRELYAFCIYFIIILIFLLRPSQHAEDSDS